MEIDITRKEPITDILLLDFDVNCLRLFPKEGIFVDSRYKTLNYFDVMNSINNKTFKVMWSTQWTPNDISTIVGRIHKMEKREWKCLNFEDIVKYVQNKFDNKLHNFIKNSKKSNIENKCGICLSKIKANQFIPTNFKECKHSDDFHHKCLVQNYLIADTFDCHICKGVIN